MVGVRVLAMGAWVLLLGCTHSAVRPHALQASISLPQHVLLAPPDIMVRHRVVPNAPTLPDPKTSAACQDWATSFISKNWSSGHKVTALSEATLSSLDLRESIGLYYLVAAQAFDIMASRASRWRHKRQNPDFTIGPGLARLAEHHHAEAILFIVGQQTQASLATKWLDVNGIVPAALTAGLVGLRSGNILWLSHVEPSTGQRFDERADLEGMLATLLSPLKGESFR